MSFSLLEPQPLDINGEIFTRYVSMIGGIGSTIAGFNDFITQLLPLRISTVTTSEGLPIYFGNNGEYKLACKVVASHMPETLKSKIGLALPSSGIADEKVRLYIRDCLKYNLTYERRYDIDFFLVDANDRPISMQPTRREITVPVMVRSKACWSSNYYSVDGNPSVTRNVTDLESLEMGLDPTDPGGYFIIYGAVQNLHYSETLRYCDIILMPSDPRDKFGDVEVRFTSPTVQGSSVVRVGYSNTYGKKRSSGAKFNYFNMTNYALGAVKRVPNTINAFLPYLLFDEFADTMAALYPEVGYSRASNPERITELIVKEFESACHVDERNRIISLITPSLEYLRRYINNPTDALMETQSGEDEEEEGEKKDLERTLLPPTKGRGKKKKKEKKKVGEMLADFMKFLYPHIPFALSQRAGKLKLHTMMILSLARHKIGRQELDDRNLWKNKKLEAPGWLMHRLFHTMWRDFLKNGIKASKTQLEVAISASELELRVSNWFREAFKGKNWGPYNSKSKKEVNDVGKPDSMAGKFAQVTRVKVQSSKHAKNELPRLVARDQIPYIDPAHTPEREQVGLTKYPTITCWTSLERSDSLGQASTIEIILTSIDSLSFTLKELEEIRKIHTLSYSHLTASSPLLTEDRNIVYNGTTYSSIQIYSKNPSTIPYLQDRVMVNGQLVGYAFGPWLQRYLIWLRRFGYPLIDPSTNQRIALTYQTRYPSITLETRTYVPFDTMIIYQEENRLVVVKTDNGRLTAPMLTANEDGTLILTRLLKEDPDLIKKGPYELLRLGGIEYVDAAEQHYCYVSTTNDHVTEKEQMVIKIKMQLREAKLRLGTFTSTKGDVNKGKKVLSDSDRTEVKKVQNYIRQLTQIQQNLQYRYTHCYISPQQMFSSTSLIDPMGNRQPGPRVLLQDNMRKQSLGIVDSTQTSLIETTLKILTEPTNPAFSTEVYDALSFYRTPTGENILLQFGTYFGYNQEDAECTKQEFIEGGGMANMKYHGTRKELEDQQFEEFKNPFSQGKGGSSNSSGEKEGEGLMADGLPVIGSYATMDKPIIGIVYENRTLTGTSMEGARNKSVKLEKLADQGIVDRVVLAPNRKMAKVRIRIYRKASPGDKYAARYGQKVTISRIARDVYFPFVTDNEFTRDRVYAAHLDQTLYLLKILEKKISPLFASENKEELLPSLLSTLPLPSDINEVVAEVFTPVYSNVKNFIYDFLEKPSLSRLNQILAYEGSYVSPKTRVEEESSGVVGRKDQVYRNYFGMRYLSAFRELTKTSNEETKKRMEVLVTALSNPYLVAINDASADLKQVISYYSDLRKNAKIGGIYRDPQGNYTYIPGKFKGSNAGLVPDVIVNPLQIVSRVTIGFVCEVAITLLCALSRAKANASRYSKTDYETLDWDLQEYGYQNNGAVQMASGITGSRFTRPSFIGMIHQESLRHQSADKISARASPMSSKDIKTHQPSGGKDGKGSGQRFGEMERDVIISHGGSSFLQERMCTASDGFPFIKCLVCNYIVTEHASIDGYECRYCHNKDHEKMRSTVTPFVVDGQIRNLLYVINTAMFTETQLDE